MFELEKSTLCLQDQAVKHVFSSHHVKHVMTGGLEVFPISTFPQAKTEQPPTPSEPTVREIYSGHLAEGLTGLLLLRHALGHPLLVAT